MEGRSQEIDYPPSHQDIEGIAGADGLTSPDPPPHPIFKNFDPISKKIQKFHVWGCSESP